MKKVAENNTEEKHYNWKGGITDKIQVIRNSKKHQKWSMLVYKKYLFKCQKCNIHCMKGNIIAHHIKPFKEYEELRFDVNNGVTLCRSCHINLHRQRRIK